MLCLLLRGVASLLALMGTLAGNLLPMVAHVYDIAIVVPLRLEQMVTKPRAAKAKVGKAGAGDPSGVSS